MSTMKTLDIPAPVRVQYLMQDIISFMEASKSAHANAIRIYVVENGRYGKAFCADDFSFRIVQFVMTREIEHTLRESGFVQVKQFVY